MGTNECGEFSTMPPVITGKQLREKAKGLALKPMQKGVDHYEVCVRELWGCLHISVHIDGVDDPVARLELPIVNERAQVRKTKRRSK